MHAWQGRDPVRLDYKSVNMYISLPNFTSCALLVYKAPHYVTCALINGVMAVIVCDEMADVITKAPNFQA